MKVIDTEAATAIFLSDRIVLVRAKPGVEINAGNARQGDKLIEDAMPSSYGQIIDRANDYSIDPVGVYGVLDRNPKLKAVAIVAHREASVNIAQIDKGLFNKELAVFASVEAARDWLERVLEE